MRSRYVNFAWPEGKSRDHKLTNAAVGSTDGGTEMYSESYPRLSIGSCCVTAKSRIVGRPVEVVSPVVWGVRTHREARGSLHDRMTFRSIHCAAPHDVV